MWRAQVRMGLGRVSGQETKKAQCKQELQHRTKCESVNMCAQRGRCRTTATNRTFGGFQETVHRRQKCYRLGAAGCCGHVVHVEHPCVQCAFTTIRRKAGARDWILSSPTTILPTHVVYGADQVGAHRRTEDQCFEVEFDVPNFIVCVQYPLCVYVPSINQSINPRLGGGLMLPQLATYK